MQSRSDLSSFKREHPIAEVVESFGIPLRPSGQALVGRCPFHLDRGRPNLHVYVATQIGRTIDSDDPRPKYLGLPGPKPLLGWEGVASAREVYLVEGVFDYLTLRSWGLPALALLGTHPRPEHLQALRRFARVYLALDNDPAGHDATERSVYQGTM